MLGSSAVCIRICLFSAHDIVARLIVFERFCDFRRDALFLKHEKTKIPQMGDFVFEYRWIT
jgi:hypothetical protein